MDARFGALAQPPLSERLMTETLIPSVNPPMRGVPLTPGGMFEGINYQRQQPFDPLDAAIGLAGGPSLASLVGPAGLVRGIRAFHGSPHKFDRFDMSRIGTGEGAQSYGHGLYFAENPATARYYRDVLAENKGSPVEQLMQMGMVDRAGGVQRTQAEAVAHLRQAEQLIRESKPPRGYTPKFTANDYAEAARRLEAGERSGHMYEVNIRANPEQFLDWDRPFSQQGPQVQSALRAQGYEPPTMQVRKGDMGSTIYNAWDLNKPAASQNLREAGIPGIKYLDQGSRTAGQGSSNYVLFDDSIIDILKRYGLMAGAAPFGALAYPDKATAASP